MAPNNGQSDATPGPTQARRWRAVRAPKAEIPEPAAPTAHAQGLDDTTGALQPLHTNGTGDAAAGDMHSVLPPSAHEHSHNDSFTCNGDAGDSQQVPMLACGDCNRLFKNRSGMFSHCHDKNHRPSPNNPKSPKPAPLVRTRIQPWRAVRNNPPCSLLLESESEFESMFITTTPWIRGYGSIKKVMPDVAVEDDEKLEIPTLQTDGSFTGGCRCKLVYSDFEAVMEHWNWVHAYRCTVCDLYFYPEQVGIEHMDAYHSAEVEVEAELEAEDKAEDKAEGRVYKGIEMEVDSGIEAEVGMVHPEIVHE